MEYNPPPDRNGYHLQSPSLHLLEICCGLNGIILPIEGFGTQDSTGIEKIKEAINSIQDDFDMILVITHIEELRDAFPTRIDVIKTAEGSTIEVS